MTFLPIDEFFLTFFRHGPLAVALGTLVLMGLGAALGTRRGSAAADLTPADAVLHCGFAFALYEMLQFPMTLLDRAAVAGLAFLPIGLSLVATVLVGFLVARYCAAAGARMVGPPEPVWVRGFHVFGGLAFLFFGIQVMAFNDGEAERMQLRLLLDPSIGISVYGFDTYAELAGIHLERGPGVDRVE
ncbi:hypothetical protein LAZ40_05625 [Cereibacter sphaeroides]|uniref:hypothetical protein n=1 Tax=Cereibacter sphaeroides TaxID=1063 RepID=UPI001F258E37|nr:hypothetical protein [Cereibacter sphaeroides]MCE6958529.1 hypothetical protein [Cereibacter sphaeroides]MCE6972808.1 hypothetical protein [Cereibacter sphaeroides]